MSDFVYEYRKLFIWRDDLFCWVGAVIARNKEEAVKALHDAGHWVFDSEPEVHEIDLPCGFRGVIPNDSLNGFVIEGGGNG